MAGCVSGGSVVEAGSGVAAPWRRLQAAALLSQAAERGILPLSFSSVSFPFLLLLWFSFPLFSLLSVLFSLSPFSLFRFFPFLSLSSVFRFLLLPPSVLLSSPLCLLSCWLLFIEPSEWLFAVEHGEQPAGRPLGATANARPPSPAFWQVRGGWSAIVSGRWAPGERVAGKKFKLKQPFFLLPRCVIGGRR